MRAGFYVDFFFFNDTATTEIYTLSLHDALPISPPLICTWTGTPTALVSSWRARSEEHTSELQSHVNLVCRLLLEKKKESRRPRGVRHAVSPSEGAGRRRGRSVLLCLCFFFNDTATTEIYTLSLHDALPISRARSPSPIPPWRRSPAASACVRDRKSTRLNSSHMSISYAVFCLKKKTTH